MSEILKCSNCDRLFNHLQNGLCDWCFMNSKRFEPNENNYQIKTGGRIYSKTFLQNRIKQAYQNGKKVGFKEKDNLIKYLENKINDYKTQFSQINGDYGLLNPKIEAYEDILERIKSGNNE